MNFVAIDFETASGYRNSACAIGISVVENGVIVHSESHLIKPIGYPYFHPIPTSLHGITAQKVKDAPTMLDLWPKISHYFTNNLIVAHNASFDISVLSHTLFEYGIEVPAFDYACSLSLSRTAFPGLPMYKLSFLTDYFGIEHKAHDAGSDASACAKLCLMIFEKLSITQNNEIREKLNSQNKKRKKQKSEWIYIEDLSLRDENSLFFEKNVLFTGSFSLGTKNELQDLIKNIGGYIYKSFSQKINYLIVGHQDTYKVGESGKSNKQRSTEKAISEGAKIEIIYETDFLQMLN